MFPDTVRIYLVAHVSGIIIKQINHNFQRIVRKHRPEYNDISGTLTAPPAVNLKVNQRNGRKTKEKLVRR